MLKKMRNLFLLRNNYLGKPKAITKEAFMALPDEEKNLADVKILDDKYIINAPIAATDEEMKEIIGITISNQLSKICGDLGEIRFIVRFCFICSIIVGLILLIVAMG